jgi:hypothetical protein
MKTKLILNIESILKKIKNNIKCKFDKKNLFIVNDIRDYNWKNTMEILP